MLKNLLIALCAICSLSPPAHSAPQTLPDDVVPVHYDLALSPDAKSLTWRGTVVIALDVKTATADVTLNADGLAFDRVVIDGSRAGKPSVDDKLGRVKLHFAAAIAPGPHTLSITMASSGARRWASLPWTIPRPRDRAERSAPTLNHPMRAGFCPAG